MREKKRARERERMRMRERQRENKSRERKNIASGASITRDNELFIRAPPPALCSKQVSLMASDAQMLPWKMSAIVRRDDGYQGNQRHIQGRRRRGPQRPVYLNSPLVDGDGIGFCLPATAKSFPGLKTPLLLILLLLN